MFTPGLVVLQDDLPIDAPTVSTGVVPPELKPVASDIVNKNCEVACIRSSIEKDPDPLLNADVGIEIFCGVPKTYSVMKIMVVGGKKFWTRTGIKSS
jgi:hypothetical protein